MSRLLRGTASFLRIRWYSNVPGQGGGGTTGSVRAAGGTFAEREHVLEEQYFRKKQHEQIEKLKAHAREAAAHHKDEIEEHVEHIKHLEKQINKYKSKISRHKAKLEELKADHDD